MESLKPIGFLLAATLLSGCCSTNPPDGPKGPELVSSGRSTASGAHYAEIGIQFTTMGDFVALVSPNRWRNPVKTGGSLSWLNPVAWSDDAGRTGRILLGEVVLAGGVAIAATADSGGSGSSSASTDAEVPVSGPTTGPGGGPPSTPF